MKKLDWIVYAVTTLSLSAIVATPIQNAYAQEIPKAQCTESSWNGKIACGYNCVESSWNGKIACAEWPGGACKESSWNGEIACGPPAPSDWLSQYANNSCNSSQTRKVCNNSGENINVTIGYENGVSQGWFRLKNRRCMNIINNPVYGVATRYYAHSLRRNNRANAFNFCKYLLTLKKIYAYFAKDCLRL